MTDKMFEALLAKAEASPSKRGAPAVADGRTVTLYVAHGGASIQISRIESLRRVDDWVEAKNHKGELYLVPLEGIYAASVSGESDGSQARKAGFQG